MAMYQGDGAGFDYVPPNDGKRHNNPNSVRYYRADEIKKIVLDKGGVWHGQDPWTIRLTDDLLNYFYEHSTKNISGLCPVKGLCIWCGRSGDAVGSKLRKLGIRYPDSMNYEPENRIDRSGTEFTLADWAVIKHAYSPKNKGVKNGANNPTWIAKLQARDPLEVEEEIKKVIRKYRSRGGLLANEFKVMDKNSHKNDELEAIRNQDLVRGIDMFIEGIFLIYRTYFSSRD